MQAGRDTIATIAAALAADPRISAMALLPILEFPDPRLRTKGYGRRFIASVPPAPVVHDLDAVEAFFTIV